jgi:hypothetical protein
LFAINEVVDGKGKQTVELETVTGYDGKYQSIFKTTDIGLGPPTLGPQNMRYPLSGKNALFFFNRPVDSIMTSTVVTGKPPASVPDAQSPTLNPNDNTTLTLPLTKTSGNPLPPGDYQLSLIFKWGGRTAPVTVPFTITSP